MYLEKDTLIGKIEEWASAKGLDLSYEEKDLLSSQTSRLLDQGRVLSFDEFSELLDHNQAIEDYSDLEFDDEIVSIEEVGEVEMVDFDVSGNRLFFANGILTHNSAVNKVDDVDNAAISDSLGTSMTADFMLFLLQDEEMKAKCEMVCKCTKNRFTGRTDTWMMNVDYEHMRFHDMKVQNAGTDVSEITGMMEKPKGTVDEDFGIVTSKKMESAKEFANSEVKSIVREDYEKVRRADSSKESGKKGGDLDDIYKELGL